jgi:uncharacterized phiE125 gp8 family phage protein
MSLVLISGPASVPISLAEAKAHLRFDLNEEDAVVAGLVRSATEAIENMTGLKLIDQVWDWSTDQFPPHCQWLRLPLAPLITVEQITYLNEQGVAMTLLPATYLVRGVGSVQPARLILAPNQTWPVTLRGPAAITVRMRVGWPDHNSIPEDLRLAVAQMVAQYFAFREPVVAGSEYGPASHVPYSVRELVAPYKLWAV